MSTSFVSNAVLGIVDMKRKKDRTPVMEESTK